MKRLDPEHHLNTIVSFHQPFWFDLSHDYSPKGVEDIVSPQYMMALQWNTTSQITRQIEKLRYSKE